MNQRSMLIPQIEIISFYLRDVLHHVGHVGWQKIKFRSIQSRKSLTLIAIAFVKLLQQ